MSQVRLCSLWGMAERERGAWWGQQLEGERSPPGGGEAKKRWGCTEARLVAPVLAPATSSLWGPQVHSLLTPIMRPESRSHRFIVGNRAP